MKYRVHFPKPKAAFPYPLKDLIIRLYDEQGLIRTETTISVEAGLASAEFDVLDEYSYKYGSTKSALGFDVLVEAFDKKRNKSDKVFLVPLAIN